MILSTQDNLYIRSTRIYSNNYPTEYSLKPLVGFQTDFFQFDILDFRLANQGGWIPLRFFSAARTMVSSVRILRVRTYLRQHMMTMKTLNMTKMRATSHVHQGRMLSSL